jgi:hypothetical protein
VASFDVLRHTALSAQDAWSRLTDWERHGDFIPLTTVRFSDGVRTGVGAAFVARTSLGPLGFDDQMEVTGWQPPAGPDPGRCHITKRGRVVMGWAELTVATAPGGALVHWHEEARFRAAGRLLDWPNRVIGEIAFGRLVDGLLADA